MEASQKFQGTFSLRSSQRQTVADGYGSERDMKPVKTVLFLCQCVPEDERLTNPDRSSTGQRQRTTVHILFVCVRACVQSCS